MCDKHGARDGKCRAAGGGPRGDLRARPGGARGTGRPRPGEAGLLSPGPLTGSGTWAEEGRGRTPPRTTATGPVDGHTGEGRAAANDLTRKVRPPKMTFSQKNKIKSVFHRLLRELFSAHHARWRAPGPRRPSEPASPAGGGPRRGHRCGRHRAPAERAPRPRPLPPAPPRGRRRVPHSSDASRRRHSGRRGRARRPVFDTFGT